MIHHAWQYYVGDFETTVYDGQTSTEVWASAVVKLKTEDVSLFHSIEETFDYLISLNRDIVIYYHNLKFDGSFWLSYFIKNPALKQATYTENGDIKTTRFKNLEEMDNGEYIYSISAHGQWYGITVKMNNRFIVFRDSLKLLPFSVKKIGKSFGTKHKKLDMTYEGYRYAGCTITDEEAEYIKNDVLVVKEALEIMFEQGHRKLTIGSCCLTEYKNIIKNTIAPYDNLFPNLYEIPLPESYGSTNVGEYIRKSYHGGWCYLVKGKENTVFTDGLTADVNSLYPSMMHSESGNYYPYGEPTRMDKGEPKYIQPDEYYFLRFKCTFHLKQDKLPTVQIKGNLSYPSNEWLESSDLVDKKTGKQYAYYEDCDGNIQKVIVEFTMTQTDWLLFNEHYDISDLEYLDYIVFKSAIGLFDDYIDKYKQIKMTSTGAIRELAKLFLNNLYGKMAANTDSSFKIVTKKPDGALVFDTIIEHEKKPGYIAIGTAITSYARNFTIRTAQKNYHPDSPYSFIYADTDSIHCNLHPDQLIDVPVHPTDFCHWKLESCWDTAIFVRQKTYIEHITHEDLKPIDTPYYNLKCAGMPAKSRALFVKNLNAESPTDDMTEAERKFLSTPRTITDFKIGLEVPDSLKARQIDGGVLLINGTYLMRERI